MSIIAIGGRKTIQVENYHNCNHVVQVYFHSEGEDNDQFVKDINSHHLVHTWKSCPTRGIKKYPINIQL